MTPRTFLFFLLILQLTACNHKPIKKRLATSKPRSEAFPVFFERFNANSAFQRSRVVFPLDYYSVIEESNEYELTNQPIDSIDYLILDLRYNDSIAQLSFEGYEQTIQTQKDTANVTFKGIDNCIHEEFIFERRKGKWYLLKVIDG